MMRGLLEIKAKWPLSCPNHDLMSREPGRIMQIESSKRQLIGGAMVALVLSVLLSFGVISGLNRYLGPIDDLPQTTGNLRHLLTN